VTTPPAAKPEPLEFPRGVRFPRPDEVPGDRVEALRRIADAQITTGFTRTDVGKPGYSAVFEANVHASRVWDVFRDLVEAIVPEVAAAIIGIKGEDPILGPYTSRAAALGALERYREPLQHDGFLEFGIIHQWRGRTEEVFVLHVKYLRIWTNAPDAVVQVLARHGLPEVPDLQFIDDYPRVSEALPFEGQSSGWYSVIEGVKARFESLPDPPPLWDA
jgi:hypothetical protein